MERLVSEGITFQDPDEQARFKAALAARGIPHEMVVGADGREQVRWPAAQRQAVREVQDALFGPPLPDGRHIGFDDDLQADFKRWLADSGIPFRTVLSRGKEYVVWEAADTPRVLAYERLPQALRDDRTP